MKVPGLAPGPQDIRVLNTDGVEATLRGGLVVRKTQNDPTEGLACEKIILHFELDKAKLDEASAKVLTEHMPCFLHAPGEVKIEGHCDERGSDEYNLALSQRRAAAVVRIYKQHGVTRAMLSTLGYGEEKPACVAASDDCWQQNRRVETLPR